MPIRMANASGSIAHNFATVSHMRRIAIAHSTCASTASTGVGEKNASPGSRYPASRAPSGHPSPHQRRRAATRDTAAPSP